MEKNNEKHIAFISKTFEEKKSNNKVMKHLIDIAEGYFQSLSVINAQNESLKQQILNFEQNNESLPTKELIKNKNEQVPTRENLEREFEEKYTREAQDLAEFYKNAISKKKEEINNFTNEHNRKINALKEQINATELNTFIKINEIETDLFNTTNQRKKQHLDNVNRINDLRIELRNLKDEFSEYKLEAHQKVLELQNKLL